MNKITMHVPAFARDAYLNDKWEYEIPFAHFETLEELLNIDFVKRHAEGRRFTQFAKDMDEPMYLMAMYDENTSWWAVGRVEDGSVLADLPDWEAVRVEK